MKKFILKSSLTKITLAVAAAAIALLATAPAQAANTAWVHGGNWASFGFYLTNNGIMFPAGITNTTTPAEATNVADTIAYDDKAIGINFVRFPIDPATVQYNWQVTQACINELIAQGLTVDIGCWYVDNNGIMPDFDTWSNMWKTIDATYSGNNMVYYEPLNEPHGYNTESDLATDVYVPFLAFIKKTQAEIILDGTNFAAGVSFLGADSRFANCLMAVHDYALWDPSKTTEAEWEADLNGRVAGYQTRTILTEFGAETCSGLNYNISSTTDHNISFIRGVTAQCRAWPMGSVYFPVHQSTMNNTKRLFNGPGGEVLSPSMVPQLQYGWNLNPSWHAWDNPAGGSGFTAGFAACSWGSFREDVFGVKSDGNIYHTWWFNNGGWASWEEHQSAVGAPPAGAPGACANKAAPGREDLFYIGTDGNLYHQYYSGGWQPNGLNNWDNLGAPAGASLAGSPTAASWGAGRYDVYARGAGSDHTVYHAYSTDGTTFSWESRSGSVTNDVACESWGINRLDAYALGLGSGAIWHQYWDGAWHPTSTTWAQNTPETDAKYALGASSWGTNSINLFDVDKATGSTVGHIWYDDSGWNGDWSETHTPPATPISAPCSTSWTVNRVDVFVLGSDGKCYHLYWGL